MTTRRATELVAHAVMRRPVSAVMVWRTVDLFMMHVGNVVATGQDAPAAMALPAATSWMMHVECVTVIAVPVQTRVALPMATAARVWTVAE